MIKKTADEKKFTRHHRFDSVFRNKHQGAIRIERAATRNHGLGRCGSATTDPNQLKEQLYGAPSPLHVQKLGRTGRR